MEDLNISVRRSPNSIPVFKCISLFVHSYIRYRKPKYIQLGGKIYVNE